MKVTHLYACLIVVLILSSCKSKTENEESSVNLVFYEGKTMGTTYHIKQCGNQIAAQEGIDSVLLDIDTALSTYNPHSLITAFNKNKLDYGLYKSVHQSYFVSVFNISDQIFRESDGAFDPCAGKLFNLFGFGENGPKADFDSTDWLDAMKHKGGSVIILYNLPVKLDSNATLNFNAVAKGFGVDEVARFLEKQGCQNYMVEIGGEVRCKGKNEYDKPWKIGINTPSEKASSDAYTKAVALLNKSTATSGNYRNFYVKDGKKYGHTIDPRIGQPAENHLLSATVFAPDCAVADAWATASMVLGVDSALAILNQKSKDSIAAYFIFDDHGILKDTATVNFKP